MYDSRTGPAPPRLLGGSCPAVGPGQARRSGRVRPGGRAGSGPAPAPLRARCASGPPGCYGIGPFGRTRARKGRAFKVTGAVHAAFKFQPWAGEKTKTCSTVRPDDKWRRGRERRGGGVWGAGEGRQVFLFSKRQTEKRVIDCYRVKTRDNATGGLKDRLRRENAGYN